MHVLIILQILTITSNAIVGILVCVSRVPMSACIFKLYTCECACNVPVATSDKIYKIQTDELWRHYSARKMQCS